MRRLKTVRRPPIYPKTPGHLPCSSLTHPLPLSSRRPSVSFGGFGLMHLQLNKFEVAREGITVPVAEEWTPDTKNSRCLIYTSPTEGRGGSRPGCGRKPLSLAKLKRPDLARLTISKRPELVS